MKTPTQTTIKRLFALSGNHCAFPGCSTHVVDFSTGSVIGEICHIKARNPGGVRFDPNQTDTERNAFGNLLLLCPNHHKEIDSSADCYTASMLYGMKETHEAAFGRTDFNGSEKIAKVLIHNLSSLNVDKNTTISANKIGSVQAETVNIRTGSKTIKINPSPGTIGADITQSKYISHLISRYNDFAKGEPGRTFSHGAISKNIEKEFGTRWQLVSSEKFEALCRYLQGRINKTRLAKINNSKGYKSFSTYDEYITKYG